MKLTLIMVATVDGIIAKDANHHTFSWNSKEDQEHFRAMSKQIGTVITGANTFRSIGEQALPGRLTYVLTRDASKMKQQDEVIFVSGSAAEIYQQIAARGIEHAALIGGAHINGLFLKAGLVDDIYLTVEPKLFGSGLHLSEATDLNLQLKLENVKQLNNQGTLLLHYFIEYKNGTQQA